MLREEFEGLTDSELFDLHFKVGTVLGNVDNLSHIYFAVAITSVDKEDLSAKGTVLITWRRRCWFVAGEDVEFEHIGDSVWRVTSEKDDHGQAVFVDEERVSFGS